DLEAVAEMRATFDRRGKLAHRLLSGIPGGSCIEPQGAFYCFPSVEGVLGRTIRGRTIPSSMTLADIVLTGAKGAFAPGAAVGAPGYGRFSFALGDDELGDGLTRLATLLS